jgi:hypothetical protein
MNIAFISESISRVSVAMFTTIPKYWGCVESYTASKDPEDNDYYQGGICFGKLLVIVFDINIDN